MCQFTNSRHWAQIVPAFLEMQCSRWAVSRSSQLAGMSGWTGCRNGASNHSQVCLWISNDNPMMTQFIQLSALLCQGQVGLIYDKPHVGRSDVSRKCNHSRSFRLECKKQQSSSYYIIVLYTNEDVPGKILVWNMPVSVQSAKTTLWGKIGKIKLRSGQVLFATFWYWFIFLITVYDSSVLHFDTQLWLFIIRVCSGATLRPVLNSNPKSEDSWLYSGMTDSFHCTQDYKVILGIDCIRHDSY